MNTPHNCSHLVNIFNDLFQSAYRTQLVGGADEPLYLPEGPGEIHQLLFREDYYASALHEIAHWCIAGGSRRKLRDYGYWYEPDGRDRPQQARFEQVEVKPQAMEWMFSEAAGFQFRISSDNLSGTGCAQSVFREEIYHQVLTYQQEGLPRRASQFMQALLEFYETAPEDVTFKEKRDGF